MTRDDLAPLVADDPGLPCECCEGAGTVRAYGGILIRCGVCFGSGYGAPPAASDRERSHCIKRLAAWAHRDTQKEEN